MVSRLVTGSWIQGCKGLSKLVWVEEAMDSLEDYVTHRDSESIEWWGTSMGFSGKKDIGCTGLSTPQQVAASLRKKGGNLLHSSREPDG